MVIRKSKTCFPYSLQSESRQPGDEVADFITARYLLSMQVKRLQTESHGYSKSNLITADGDGSPHVHTQGDTFIQ